MHERFDRLLKQLSKGLYEKEEALGLGLLALTAGESLFLLGPPGVAKSLVARRLKAAMKSANAFEYLMGRFSTPEEIFGPLSIAGLRDHDVFERKTDGYLPKADIAFLDEIWRASPPIQNTLLTILNEKVFRNGSKEERVPLKLLIGASNRLAEGDENAEAFWDRFILRLEIGSVKEADNFRLMLTATEDLYRPAVAEEDKLSVDEWSTYQKEIDTVAIPDFLLEALQELRTELTDEVYVSDRRWKKAARILKTSAFLHGRAEVNPLDLGLLEHMLWHKVDEKAEISSLLVEILADFGWKSSVDGDQLKEGVEVLRSALEELTLKRRVVTQAKPVLADGEYYTLMGYPDALSVRIWAQDHSLLKQEEELEGELFFFQPAGAFVRSEKHALRKAAGSAEIEVDGRLFALESRPEEVEVWDRIQPDGPSIKLWEKRVREHSDAVISARETIDKELTEQVRTGERHLFVGDPYLSACRKSLEKLSDDLARSLVELDNLAESRDSGR